MNSFRMRVCTHAKVGLGAAALLGIPKTGVLRPFPLVSMTNKKTEKVHPKFLPQSRLSELPALWNVLVCAGHRGSA